MKDGSMSNTAIAFGLMYIVGCLSMPAVMVYYGIEKGILVALASAIFKVAADVEQLKNNQK